jgi:haloalkane dehalogenase
MTCQIPDVIAGYDAPFPDARYKAGPLAMPQLVPMSPDNPARDANRAAWDVLRQWQKPFVTAFGDSDPITGGGDKKFQREVPGAQNRQHHILEKAGHFLQETHSQELAEIIDPLTRKAEGDYTASNAT